MESLVKQDPAFVRVELSTKLTPRKWDRLEEAD